MHKGDLISADKGFVIQDILPPSVLHKICHYLVVDSVTDEAEQDMATLQTVQHLQRTDRGVSE